MRQRVRGAVAAAAAVAVMSGGAVVTGVVGASMAAGAGSVLLENDFDTTFEPWGPRGAVTLEITDDARTGAGALAVTGRTAEWNGPSTAVDDLLTPGSDYAVEAWVKLPAGTEGSTALHFTVQETSADGDAYTWVGGAVDATAGEWVRIGGDYTMPDGLTAAQLYVEAAPVDGEHPSFLVDDLAVTGTDPVGSEVVLSTDFEAGLDGWGPRAGDATDPSVEVTTDDAHGGAQSALLTGRDSQGDGIGRDVTGVLAPGTAHDLTAWVRFAPGQATDSVWLSLASTTGGETSYATLAQFSDVTADGWTQVTATFQVPEAEQSYLYLETDYNTTNTSDLLVDDVVVEVPAPSPVQDLLPIKDTTDFPMGVAIDDRETTGPASELLLRHFDQITAENHMKPEAWYDEDRSFRPHPQAVALMDYAVANDLDVYGHVLVWHSQTPDWFFQAADGTPLTTSATDQEILRERLRTHVDDVAGWLADTYGEFGAGNPVTAFDVVNEVVNDGATSDPDDGLRRSEWYRILGEDFIDLAFQYADEAFNTTHAATGADRPVKLFINDYNTEQSGKQDRYRALVERLLERGVPVDGVGHQFHVSLSMPVSALTTALDRFADLPVTQAVTELDVTIGSPETDANLVEQGYWFRDAFAMFRDHADDLFSVTVWGLTDGRSWRADSGAPLLFDDRMQAKPAYHGVVDGDLPARLQSANVFAGDVPLDDDAAGSPVWDRLPRQTITAGGATAGERVADFQLRWAPDHLTAHVAVLDGTADGDDAVTFDVDGQAVVVGRDGSVAQDGATAVVTETDGGYTVVAHLPLDGALPGGAAQGDTVGLDVRVSDGGTESGWNTPGALGTLTLLEELSYLEVAQAPAAVQVDGEVDDAWSAAGSVTTDQQIEGDGGAVATVRTLWSDDTLYVLAEVADPEVDLTGSDPWVQDSVEIFLDAGNAKNGAYRDVDTQIRINADNVTSFGTGDEAAQAARLTSATARVDGGYVVEAAIDLLGTGGAGTFHGLDFQVNDATAGARTAVRDWADPTGTGYQSTARWGVGQLVAAPAPEGLVSTVAPTVQGSAVWPAGRLTATTGTWTLDGEAVEPRFTYQWLRGGHEIRLGRFWAADDVTYRTTLFDLGQQVSVRVTAHVDGADPVSVTSDVVRVRFDWPF